MFGTVPAARMHLVAFDLPNLASSTAYTEAQSSDVVLGDLVSTPTDPD